MKKISVIIIAICFIFLFTACNEKNDKPEWDSFYENARFTYVQYYDSTAWDIEVSENHNDFIEEYEIENPPGDERAGLINTFTYKESPDFEVAIYGIRSFTDSMDMRTTVNEIYKNFMDESKYYYFNKLFIKDEVRENFKFAEYDDINKLHKNIGGYLYHTGEETHETTRTIFQIEYTFTRNGKAYNGLLIIEVDWYICTLLTFEAKETNFKKYNEEIYCFLQGSGTYCY